MQADLDGFRTEVRSFISTHGVTMEREGVRVPRDEQHEQQIREWLGSLYAAGYLGRGWPQEWGGTEDHLPAHDLIVMEELILGNAYRPLDQVMLAAHTLIEFGSEAQKESLLPKIRSGEHIWCQLFSEPDAGSDLASLRTRAEPEGDGWRVTGQKIWSTDAQWADMGTLLARTDPSVDRHAGITAFIIPMDLPGMEIRPIREMTGHAEFCEVFFDDVRVEREHVLGAVDGGWSVRRRQRSAAGATVPRPCHAGHQRSVARRYERHRPRRHPGDLGQRACPRPRGAANRARHRRPHPRRR